MSERREILTFLCLTLVLSSGFYLYLLSAESPAWNDSLSFGFMWCPGLAALLTRLLASRSVRGLGWRWGGTSRVLLPVAAFPFLLAGVVYALVWTLGLGDFDPSRLSGLARRLGVPGTWVQLAMIALIPVGVALSVPSALGEELGWRGLLADRLLRRTGWVGTSLLIGAIWSVWHYPLIFAFIPRFRPDLPVLYATACFTASVMGVSFFYTWLRQTTGSVWPAAILHAASNSAQSAFEAMTRDTGPTEYWTYEYGIGFVLVIWIFLAIFWRRFARAMSPPPLPSASWPPPSAAGEGARG